MANTLIQYSSRTVPSIIDILGLSDPSATVTINSASPDYRRGEYFQKRVSVANASAPVWQNNNITAGGTTVSGNVYVPTALENFNYDADGNLTNDVRWAYFWDAENRLVTMVSKISNGPLRLDFEYDAQGRRIRKKVWSNTAGTGIPTTDTIFVYDGRNLLGELDAKNSKAVVRNYQWGSDLSGSMSDAGGVGGLISVRVSGGAAQFAASDGNGNVVGLVGGSNGVSSAEYEYGPFGEMLRQSGLQYANPFRFSTKYQDDESELIYYGYRFLTVGAGRWLSRDPLEERGGLNVYSFVDNKPTLSIDLNGLDSWSELEAQWLRMVNFTEDVWARISGTGANAIFFKDWLLNKGSDDRYYGANDRLTKLLAESNGAKEMVAKYRGAGCPAFFADGYATLRGYKDVFFHWGILNPAEWQIGGFLFTVRRTGPCRVLYVVVNYATIESIVGEPTARGWSERFLHFTWTPWPRFDRPDVRFGGAIKQTFTWEDTDPCCCGSKGTRQE